MTTEAPQELADRPVVEDRVVARLARPEPVFAGFVGGEHPTEVPVGLHALLLHVVEPVVVGLPDVDKGAPHRVASNVEHATADDHRLAFAVEADVGARGITRRLRHVEWPRMVFSVAPLGRRWLMASTNIDTPRMSDSRIYLRRHSLRI